MSDYPSTRVTHGYRTETAFVDQIARDGREPRVVYQEMRDNLENQKRGYEWRVKRMVPTLDKWLSEGRWKQRHEEEPADALAPKTQRTLAALDSIRRKENP